MDIIQGAVFLIYLYVLETIYLEYGHRKEMYLLKDKMYAMSSNKLVSVLMFVVTFGLFNDTSYHDIYGYLGLSHGMSAHVAAHIYVKVIGTVICTFSFYKFYIFLQNNKESVHRYRPIILLNIFAVVLVLFFNNIWKEILNYIYLLSTLYVVVFYYILVLDKDEKSETLLIYIIVILLNVVNFIFMAEYNNIFGVFLKKVIAGFLFISFLITSISQQNKQTSLKEREFRHEISKSLEIKNKLDDISNRDMLTGLRNSNALKVFVDSVCKDSSANFCLIMINIDNFKSFNNYYGFEHGDLLLVIFAEFLTNKAENTHTVYRLNADQYAILYRGSIFSAIEFSKSLLGYLRENSLKDSTNEFSVTVSMGISETSHTKKFDTLYKESELALTEAKRSGKNRYCVFESSLTETVDEKLKIERLLESRIATESFFLYCQPKVDARTLKIIGGEILLRCKDDNGDFISPAKFIPIAEETGMIEKIDAIVISRSFNFIKNLQDNGINIPISINISPQEFLRYDFISKINSMVEEHEILKRNIVLEITENSLISNIKSATNIVKELKLSGFNISLDDFGTGYSSLNYLVNLPVDEVKIDRSLIIDLVSNYKNFVFLKKLIELLGSIGMSIIVEGVETDEQVTKILEAGAYAYQGFYAYKPMPIEEFKQIVVNQKGNINVH